MESSSSASEAVDISWDQLHSLKPNQAVNITATISIGECSPKKIHIKSSGKSIQLKEDCIVEDKTGNCEIHVWEPLFLTLENGKTYKFTNVSVKHYKGACFLATKPNTEVTEVEQQIDTITAYDLLKSPEKEITIQHFAMIKALTIFYSCQNCQRKMIGSYQRRLQLQDNSKGGRLHKTSFCNVED
eukprot:gene1535-1698_t